MLIKIILQKKFFFCKKIAFCKIKLAFLNLYYQAILYPVCEVISILDFHFFISCIYLTLILYPVSLSYFLSLLTFIFVFYVRYPLPCTISSFILYPLTSTVYSFILYSVSCILYHVSFTTLFCIMYSYHVSYSIYYLFLYPISCILHPVFCIL